MNNIYIYIDIFISIFISSRLASQKESSHIQPRPRCLKAGALTNFLAQFPGLYAKL